MIARRALLIFLLVPALAATAFAGGGPETTLVVANADSPASLRIANAYARLRDLPPNHVLYLEDVPTQPVIAVETFRTRILQPIEDYLARQGLSDDVDTIAYSADFPYGVDFSADLKASDFRPDQRITRTASLTGLTFLYRRVLAKDPRGYLGDPPNFGTNNYFRRPVGLAARSRPPTPQERALEADARGALQSKDFKRAAEALSKLVRLAPTNGGHWYNLACCLALLDEPDDALDALEKAVENGFRDADHTAADADLESLRARPEFQRLLDAMREIRPVQPTRAFTARAAWTGGDAPDESAPADSLDRYRLAVMLGWVGAYGNTQDEVLACLERAAGSDGTRPDGTVYFMVHKDVRSTTRQPLFEGAAEALRRHGRKAEILRQGEDGQDGVLPRGKGDVFGLVAGIASFQWPADMPPLLPGSIAEHLTSFGAHFGTAGQTKCTEFIRHGAAGTSGTVAEPLAQQQKFPVPYMHDHYAQGCSLAEAFYQSVWGPYQLLILGDPLARPLAVFSEVALTSPDPATPWKGTVSVEASVTPPRGGATRAVELWVDGRRVGEAPPGQPLAWDTTQVADGVHEIRLVSVDAGPIRTRSYAKALVHVANGALELESETPEAEVAYGDPVRVEGKAKGPEAVEVRRGEQVLARAPVKGGHFRVEVPSSELGLGPVTLTVHGASAEGLAVLGAPLAITVVPPKGNLVPVVVPEAELLPGLRAVVKDAAGESHEGLVVTLGAGPGRTLRQDLKALGVEEPAAVHLEGLLRASASGLWEVELRSGGPARCRIDGRDAVAFDAESAGGRRTVLLGLEQGWHDLVIEADGPRSREVALYLGGAAPTGPAADRVLAHVEPDTKPAAAPEAVVLSGQEKHEAGLVDGNRGGKGVDAPGDGVEIHWKKTERGLVGVVLFPDRSKGAPALPDEWIVERRTSTHGRWSTVKKVEVRVCPGPEPPGKDGPPIHRAVELLFDKTSARELRVRPADGSAAPRLVEVEVLAYERKRR